MKMMLTKKEVKKAFESKEVAKEFIKAIGEDVEIVKDADMKNQILNAIKMFNAKAKNIKININILSNDNFLDIYIDEKISLQFMNLYLGFIKETINPIVSIMKSIEKFYSDLDEIQKNI